MKLSELLEAHGMTLKDGAMVCKAGDWPEGDADTPMPESDNPFDKEAMDYAMERVIGHRDHVAHVLDAEGEKIYSRGYDTALQDQWRADHPYGRDGLS